MVVYCQSHADLVRKCSRLSISTNNLISRTFSHVHIRTVRSCSCESLQYVCSKAAGESNIEIFLFFPSYYDYIYGIDAPTTTTTKGNKGKTKNDPDVIDDRTLIEGLLQPNDVVRLGLILYAIGTVSFLLLTHFSPAKEPYLALIFFGALPLSFLYTGGIGNESSSRHHSFQSFLSNF